MPRQASIPHGQLNAVCPYFTMFPLAFPYRILKRHARGKRAVVLDPFCGRGTTNYAARLLGHVSHGIDSSRVAVAATRAKLVSATPGEIIAETRRLLEAVKEAEVPSGEFWTLAYHPRTLGQLCRLRRALLDSLTDQRIGAALTGLLLGALHGPVARRGTSYLSNQCPRTYAPKPRYAAAFWRSRGLAPPEVDAVAIVAARAQRYYGSAALLPDASAVVGDSRELAPFDALLASDARASWVITSPPYYGLRTYIPDQWLRNWFLGGLPNVDYSHAGQLSHTGTEAFTNGLRNVWRNAAQASLPGARMVVRFGSISDRRVDRPFDLLQSSLWDTGWAVTATRAAGTARDGRRQAETFRTTGAPLAEVDVWARLEA